MPERISVESITMTKNGRGFTGAGPQKIAEALAQLSEGIPSGSVLTFQEDGTVVWGAPVAVASAEGLDLDALAAAVAEKLRNLPAEKPLESTETPAAATDAPETDTETPEVDTNDPEPVTETPAAPTEPAKAPRASKAAAAVPSADTK